MNLLAPIGIPLCLASVLMVAGCGGSSTPADSAPPTASPRLETPFMAGAARVPLLVPGEVCTGGYGIFCGRKSGTPRLNAKGQADTLYTRALALRDPEGATLVIVTTSAIGLFAAYKPGVGAVDAASRPGLYAVRGQIADELQIPIEHVLIQPDHSHFSPDSVGIWGGATDGAQFEALLQGYATSMVAAASEAYAHLEPAALLAGAVDGATVACPSPIPFCVPSSLYSATPNLVTDDVFRMIEARRADGSRIASFVNYSPHATVLDDFGDDIALSGDWTSWIAADLDETGDCGSRRCAIGVATLATLGRTDFNNSSAGAGDDASGPERNLIRERNARARLDYLQQVLREGRAQTGLLPFAPVGGDQAIVVRERMLREAVFQPIFYANYLPYVGLPQALAQGPFAESTFTNSTASIERANLPPWLSGNVLGAPVSALRIGDLFFGTAPGEEFPNAMQTLRDGGGVQGVRLHFFLGVTNDFIGYLGPTNGYDQVAAQGAFYLAGCPEDAYAPELQALFAPLAALGYDPQRLFDANSCPDHFVLMASPFFGDHITCSIQQMAAELGLPTGAADPICALLTVSDQPGGRL